MEQALALDGKVATAPHEPSDYRYLVVNLHVWRYTGLLSCSGLAKRFGK
jgi:hypothetical protein